MNDERVMNLSSLNVKRVTYNSIEDLIYMNHYPYQLYESLALPLTEEI